MESEYCDEEPQWEHLVDQRDTPFEALHRQEQLELITQALRGIGRAASGGVGFAAISKASAITKSPTRCKFLWER